jgi:hypothetical protein
MFSGPMFRFLSGLPVIVVSAWAAGIELELLLGM